MFQIDCLPLTSISRVPSNATPQAPIESLAIARRWRRFLYAEAQDHLWVEHHQPVMMADKTAPRRATLEFWSERVDC